MVAESGEGGNAPGETPRRALVPSAAVLACAFLLHLWIQLDARGFGGRDAYFHAGLAEQILAGEAPWHGGRFPWLVLNAFADRPLDWALGWRLLLLPFVAAFGAVTGAKVAFAAQAAVLTTVFHGTLRSLRVRTALPWTVVLLFASTPWLGRVHIGRPTPLLLAALLVLFTAVLRRRDRLAGAAAFAALLLYHVPPPALLVAGVALVAVTVADRRPPWRTAGSVLAGTALGVLIHPGFHDTAGGFFSLDRGSLALWDLMRGSVEFADAGGAVNVGDAAFGLPLPAELVAPTLAELWRDLPGTLLVTGLAVVAALLRRDRLSLACAAMALVALSLTFRSGRFFEYWQPFAVLAAAVATGAARNGAPPRLGRAIAWTAAVLATLGMARVLPGFLDRYQPDRTHELDGAVAALKESAAPGDVVWNSSFGEFGPLFFRAPEQRYVTGMDSWYLVAHDVLAARDFARTASGDARGEDLRRLLSERFDARFVLLWSERSGAGGRVDKTALLRRHLEAADWARVLHRDDAVMLFRLD